MATQSKSTFAPYWVSFQGVVARTGFGRQPRRVVQVGRNYLGVSLALRAKSAQSEAVKSSFYDKLRVQGATVLFFVYHYCLEAYGRNPAICKVVKQLRWGGAVT